LGRRIAVVTEDMRLFYLAAIAGSTAGKCGLLPPSLLLPIKRRCGHVTFTALSSASWLLAGRRKNTNDANTWWQTLNSYRQGRSSRRNPDRISRLRPCQGKLGVGSAYDLILVAANAGGPRVDGWCPIGVESGPANCLRHSSRCFADDGICIHTTQYDLPIYLSLFVQ